MNTPRAPFLLGGYVDTVEIFKTKLNITIELLFTVSPVAPLREHVFVSLNHLYIPGIPLTNHVIAFCHLLHRPVIALLRA